MAMRRNLFICIAMVTLLSSGHCFHLFKKNSAFDYLFHKSINEENATQSEKAIPALIPGSTEAPNNSTLITTGLWAMDNVTTEAPPVSSAPGSTHSPVKFYPNQEEDDQRYKKSVDAKNLDSTRKWSSKQRSWPEPDRDWVRFFKTLFPETVDDLEEFTKPAKRADTAFQVILNQEKIAEEDRKLKELRIELAKIQKDLDYLKSESKKLESLTSQKDIYGASPEVILDDSYPYERRSYDYMPSPIHSGIPERKREFSSSLYQRPIQELKDFENSFHPKFSLGGAFLLPRFHRMMQRKNSIA